MLRFVHTGDLHLDSPFLGLASEAPASVTAFLREATFQAWKEVIELALHEHAQFVLVAGDVFEHANHTLRGQFAFRDGLARLANAGIPSFVVTGNHDPESGWAPSVAWPELAHRFPTDRVEGVPVVRDGEEVARIYGISYRNREVRSNLALKFKREANVPFAVGLLHANVGCDPSAPDYAPCSLADLRVADMNYWALGHVHKPRVLTDGYPTVVYCGNIQGRDPGETEPRGCYLVTVDDAGTIYPEFQAADVVRWQSIDVSIDEIADEETLVDRIAAGVDEARTQADRSIVARVRLTGRGPMHRTLSKAGVLRDAQTVVRERLGDAIPFAWVESIRDESRPLVDLEERRLADDFLGDALKRFAEVQLALAEAGTANNAATEGNTDQAVGLPAQLDEVLDRLYANERARRYLRDSRPGPTDLRNLLNHAETLVADRLSGEE